MQAVIIILAVLGGVWAAVTLATFGFGMWVIYNIEKDMKSTEDRLKGEGLL